VFVIIYNDRSVNRLNLSPINCRHTLDVSAAYTYSTVALHANLSPISHCQNDGATVEWSTPVLLQIQLKSPRFQG